MDDFAVVKAMVRMGCGVIRINAMTRIAAVVAAGGLLEMKLHAPWREPGDE